MPLSVGRQYLSITHNINKMIFVMDAERNGRRLSPPFTNKATNNYLLIALLKCMGFVLICERLERLVACHDLLLLFVEGDLEACTISGVGHHGCDGVVVTGLDRSVGLGVPVAD